MAVTSLKMYLLDTGVKSLLMSNF